MICSFSPPIMHSQSIHSLVFLSYCWLFSYCCSTCNFDCYSLSSLLLLLLMLLIWYYEMNASYCMALQFDNTIQSQRLKVIHPILVGVMLYPLPTLPYDTAVQHATHQSLSLWGSSKWKGISYSSFVHHPKEDFLRKSFHFS